MIKKRAKNYIKMRKKSKNKSKTANENIQKDYKKENINTTAGWMVGPILLYNYTHMIVIALIHLFNPYKNDGSDICILSEELLYYRCSLELQEHKRLVTPYPAGGTVGPSFF